MKVRHFNVGLSVILVEYKLIKCGAHSGKVIAPSCRVVTRHPSVCVWGEGGGQRFRLWLSERIMK